MSVIATALRHMLAAGMGHEAVVRAVADMEALAGQPDAAAEKRRAWDRDRKRAQKSTESGGIPVETVEIEAAAVSLSPEPPNPSAPSPYPPLKGVLSPSLSVAAEPLPAKPDDAKTAVAEWNDLAKRLGLPIAKTADKARLAAVRARLAEGGLPLWREALVAVDRSPFCRGDNDRGFRADLDFVCQPKSWRRLLEGFYGPKGVARPRPAAAPTTPPTEAVIQRRLKHYRDTGEWRDGWGARPQLGTPIANDLIKPDPDLRRA